MIDQLCECFKHENSKTGWNCPRCGKVTQPLEMVGTMFRKHKYNAKATIIDGIKFASKKEANRYCELKLLVQAEEITELTLQPCFELQPSFVANTEDRIRPISYVADFQYIEDGKTIIEDSKGFLTPEFKLKRKMFLYHYPNLELRLT